MAFVKKTWKDRLVEFAGRRQLKRISGDANGTMVVDVARAEGTVSQAGDTFSAANMNDLEQRIGDGFNVVVENLYVGNDGLLHKVQGGADSALPFKKATTKYVQIYASAIGVYDGSGGILTGLTLKVNGTTVFSQNKNGQGQSIDTTYTYTVQP